MRERNFRMDSLFWSLMFMPSKITSPDVASCNLKMVLPKIEAKEAENRSNGRSRVKLPPTGLTQEKTTYKMSEIQKLVSTDRAKYKELMNRRDKGEITIV